MSAVVSCVRGDRVLAVPVSAGIADLGRAMLVRGVARELLARVESGADLAELSAHLLGAGAQSTAAADADAAGFLAALDGRSAPAPSAEVEVSGEDLAALARTVLERGVTLRFRALGASMRPSIPHGSVLEVECRPLEELDRGAIVLYSAGAHPLVAHRVIGRAGERLKTRGDSSPRVDEVTAETYLGLVVRCQRPDGASADLESGRGRFLGLWRGRLYSFCVSIVRWCVVKPLRASFPERSFVRAALRGVLRFASGVLLRMERWTRRLRESFDPLRAALLSTAEKDAQRRKLYERRTVQQFTSLDENVAAGLTLIEELAIARHAKPGRCLVVGCGPGRESIALAERGYEVHGIDREPGMLDRARDLAARRGLAAQFTQAEAECFELEAPPFDHAVIFSGLYNMVLPRTRRVAMLRCVHQHLHATNGEPGLGEASRSTAGGLVLVTFFSQYVPPGTWPRPAHTTLLEAINPEHQDGDRFLLNETIHVFPRAQDVVDEAAEAGFDCVELFRDQRAYDRAEGRVRSFVALRRSATP